jgi:hypothetical protein
MCLLQKAHYLCFLDLNSFKSVHGCCMYLFCFFPAFICFFLCIYLFFSCIYLFFHVFSCFFLYLLKKIPVYICFSLYLFKFDEQVNIYIIKIALLHTFAHNCLYLFKIIALEVNNIIMAVM